MECLKCGEKLNLIKRDLSKIHQVSLCEKCNYKFYRKDIDMKNLIKKYERYFILKEFGCNTKQEESELNALTIELQHELTNFKESE